VNAGRTEIRDGQSPAAGDGPVVTAAANVMLFILGAVLGLIGAFQYSRGPVPAVAIGFDLAILVTCVLGSWGMRSAVGGVMPAAGWLITTLLLSSVSSGGTVLITDTSAGKWFLFGGALCAAAGAVYGFARWSRPRAHR
jgi:Family of unknown function (DUF6113)